MAVYRYVVDEYCTARRSVVVRSFLDALTVGGPHGTPRPMEVHAHDPPRYVGDMLAWSVSRFPFPSVHFFVSLHRFEEKTSFLQ